MVQSSGRFKTVHTGCYLSAKAYGAACDEPLGHELEAEWLEAERLSRVVHRFETALYGALLRGQSKKRYFHARFSLGSVRNSHWASANGREC
jgi:hypothetical protein